MNEKLKKPLQALLIATDEKMRENILNRKKKITIIEGWGDYQNGPCMVCCHIEPWCVGIDIKDVRYSIIKDVKPEEYIADGYNFTSEMTKDLQRFYPKIDLESKVTIIKWDDANGKLVDEYKNKK
jgi:hypothetical protein